MSYDEENIFARILRGEIPCDKVYEDDHVLAFNDISPQKPVHILVIPKGQYISINDFNRDASDEEIVAFHRAVSQIIADKDLDHKGFRVITNAGEHGGQEVPHFHLHILGGAPVGKMIDS